MKEQGRPCVKGAPVVWCGGADETHFELCSWHRMRR